MATKKMTLKASRSNMRSLSEIVSSAQRSLGFSGINGLALKLLELHSQLAVPGRSAVSHAGVSIDLARWLRLDARGFGGIASMRVLKVAALCVALVGCALQQAEKAPVGSRIDDFQDDLRRD
jgi:hypothetical protein